MTEALRSNSKEKNYAGSEKTLPTLIRKRSHFGTGYRKTPPPKGKGKINGDQEGCRLGLKLSPEDNG
jgi:hypothetical protein